MKPINPERADAETWKASEYNPASSPRQGQRGTMRPSQAGDAEQPDGIDRQSNNSGAHSKHCALRWERILMSNFSLIHAMNKGLGMVPNDSALQIRG